MPAIPGNQNVLREIVLLSAISLLLAAASWLIQGRELPLRADPNTYELDIAFPLLSPPTALELYDGAQHLFIDARERDSFDTAHIPGAMNLRPAYFDQDLREVFDWILPEDRFVIYDTGNLKEAAAVCARLSERGYENVEILNGNLDSWHKAGGEISGGDHD